MNNRQPAGSPTGGQFASAPASEAELTLDQAGSAPAVGTFRGTTTRDATGQQYDGQDVVAANDLGDGTCEVQFRDGQWALVDTAELEPRTVNRA